ncbi:MAG: hypothetical protein QNJ84_01535 [Alphaproteobacteria bacterium]|nr:hypothetical protein [Alphaproteobacteria bacterium]
MDLDIPTAEVFEPRLMLARCNAAWSGLGSGSRISSPAPSSI